MIRIDHSNDRTLQHVGIHSRDINFEAPQSRQETAERRAELLRRTVEIAWGTMATTVRQIYTEQPINAFTR